METYRVQGPTEPLPDAGVVDAYLRANGFTLADGVSVEADGIITMTCDPNPTAMLEQWTPPPPPEPIDYGAALLVALTGTAAERAATAAKVAATMEGSGAERVQSLMRATLGGNP